MGAVGCEHVSVRLELEHQEEGVHGEEDDGCSVGKPLDAGRTLLPSEKKSLDEALATVEDPEIKKKLTTFGKAVLQDRSSGL